MPTELANNTNKLWCFCDRKARAASAQSFALWQQATIDITCRDYFIIACLCHLYRNVVLRAHSVRGETCIQRNASREVATTSPPFSKNRTDSSSFCEGFTWLELHILVTAPFCCDWKSPSGMCTKLRTVAASNNKDHTQWSLYYCLFAPLIWVLFFVHIPFVVNHVFSAMPAQRLQQS